MFPPKFPPNACRGERCGVWGRTAPIKPVRQLETVFDGGIGGAPSILL